jgi:hypothetical protein
MNLIKIDKRGNMIATPPAPLLQDELMEYIDNHSRIHQETRGAEKHRTVRIVTKPMHVFKKAGFNHALVGKAIVNLIIPVDAQIHVNDGPIRRRPERHLATDIASNREAMRAPTVAIVSGMARGADKLAVRFARQYVYVLHKFPLSGGPRMAISTSLPASNAINRWLNSQMDCSLSGMEKVKAPHT